MLPDDNPADPLGTAETTAGAPRLAAGDRRDDSGAFGTSTRQEGRYPLKPTPGQNPAESGLLRRPKPARTQDTAFFWEQADLHRLVIQRCCRCSTLRHPPMPVCPRCHSFGWDFVASSGRGVLFSFTTIHAPLADPFDRPYGVGIVELEEKTRLVAMLHEDPTPWRIGMRVKVGFVDCDGGFALPVICPEVA